MLYSYFEEVPLEIVDVAHIDGARPLQQLGFVLLPQAAPGVASTALLAVILSWNVSFWCINVTAANASTLASCSNPEGFFWAKLSAASRPSVAPIMVFGLADPAPARAWPHLRAVKWGDMAVAGLNGPGRKDRVPRG